MAMKVINSQVELICDKLDIDMLEDSMDKIINTCTFFETFERESSQVVVKYTPYRKKIGEVMNFEWTSVEEYNN